MLAGSSALLIGMALLMLGAGLQATLLALRATLEGFPTFVTGVVMACYYIGYVGGSIAAPELVRRVGHIRVFAAFTATAAAAILIQGSFVSAAAWAVLRGISGVCFAGIYVVAESWLNDRADRQSRGMLLAVYMVVIYVGLGAGQFLLQLGNPGALELFVLIAILMCLAVVPISLTAQRAPEFALPQRVGFRDLFALSPLGTGGVVFSGATSATLFSLGPVFAASSGFDKSGIALFMACGILPAVVLQLPLGRYSDRIDRRSVLIAMALAAGASAGATLLLNASANAPFLAAVIAYGGLSLTTYALCVAHINDHLRPEQMVAASGTIILLNGAGAIAGPIAISAAMQLAGPRAYFASVATLHLAFAVFALWRKQHRAAIPSEDKTRFAGAPPQVAPTGRLGIPESKEA